MTFLSYDSSAPNPEDDDTLWGWDSSALVGVGLSPTEQLREVRIAPDWKSKIAADSLSSAVFAAYLRALMARVSTYPEETTPQTVDEPLVRPSADADEIPEIDDELMQRVQRELDDYLETYQESLADEQTFVSSDGNVTVTARGGSPSAITFDSAWLGFAGSGHIVASTTEVLARGIESGRAIDARMSAQFPAIAEFRRLRKRISAARGR